MSFNINPLSLVGSAVENAVTAQIIVGLPSPQALIPNFILAIVPQEKTQTSVQLGAMQITQGDFALKSAVNPGKYTIMFSLTDNPNFPASWLSTVSTIIQSATALGNQILSGGAILPNLTGIGGGFAAAQLATLQNMKNGRQAIMILNTFVPLGSVSQTSPFLQSAWYIESIDTDKDESDDGFEVVLTLREQLSKRDASLTSYKSFINIGAEVVAPGVGSSVGAFLP